MTSVVGGRAGRFATKRIFGLVAIGLAVLLALVFWLHRVATNRLATSMWKSYDHLVVFGPSQREVAAALADREAAISPTVNGFTLVADQELARHDSKRTLALATDLSRRLACPVIEVNQFKGDVLYYTLIEAGAVTDEYASEPDYFDFKFEHVPPRSPQGGNTERLCAALHRPDARERVDHILHGAYLSDAADRHAQVVEALGMPKFAVGFGLAALHGAYPEGLTDGDVLLTATARESREIEKKSKPLDQKVKRDEVKLPTGKVIRRSFDGSGALVTEFHVYGDAKAGTVIGVQMRFAHGRKTGESYFRNRRLVSRDVYEHERAQYSDMPPADLSVRDTGSDGLEEMALRQQAQFEQPKGAYDAGKANDAFCLKAMSRGRQANASEWVKSENHTLAEMDSAESRALIARLRELGAVAIYACGIYSSPDGHDNTARLVVELPTAAVRAALLREIRPFAQRFALQDDVDNGQRYAFVRVGF